MKVLVTGADGFIGSHLTERLVNDGHDVRAFVYYNSFGSWGWLDHAPKAVRDGIEVFAGDIRDPNGVRTAMTGCDVVLHLAALIAIPYSYHSPDSYVDTNIKGTLNVLQAARDLGVRRVVQTSTSEVYGTARFVPITEDHPLQGQSPYSATKIGSDQLALSYHRSFGLPVAVIRPFNVFGPRQSARAVIPTIITQALAGREIRLGSLHPTRDLTFVLDTVDAFVRSIDAPGIEGEVYNVGSGFEVSVGDLARKIVQLVGKDCPIVSEDKRLRPQASEVERLWADSSRARTLLGWQPSRSLEEGLAASIEWFAGNLGSYRVGEYTI